MNTIDKDKARLYNAVWRSRNREYSREYQRLWRKRNQEKCRTSQKKYNDSHKEQRELYAIKQKCRIRETALMRMYGMTTEKYNTTLAKQGSVCAICGLHNRNKHPLYVDHDHTTKNVRGLLCRDCNLGLGYFKDNEDFLRRATEYVLVNKTKRLTPV